MNFHQCEINGLDRVKPPVLLKNTDFSGYSAKRLSTAFCESPESLDFFQSSK
jgi:hypothetical protein